MIRVESLSRKEKSKKKHQRKAAINRMQKAGAMRFGTIAEPVSSEVMLDLEMIRWKDA